MYVCTCTSLYVLVYAFIYVYIYLKTMFWVTFGQSRTLLMYAKAEWLETRQLKKNYV